MIWNGRADRCPAADAEYVSQTRIFETCMRHSSKTLAVLVLVFAGASRADAQVPVTSITLGWAVDTAVVPVRQIVQTLTAYYELPQPGRTRTPLWSAEEQTRYPVYDLAASQLYRARVPATIVRVSPATLDSSVYIVQTLFAVADSAGKNIQPFGLQRLYAKAATPGSGAPYGWQLAGALAELTRSWTTRRIGGISYHFPPDYSFRASRARVADAFVDSAAKRLGVERPEEIDYYVTPSWEEVNRLVGLDWGLSGVAFAGRAFPANRLVLAGNPVLGEAFTHELAHVVLHALGPAEQRHRMIEEGVATWLGGGNRGAGVATYYDLLHKYQVQNPDMTLGGLLARFDAEEAFYATGALAAEASVQRGGRAALRRLLSIGPGNEDLLKELSELIGVAPDSLDVWWRDAITRRAPVH